VTTVHQCNHLFTGNIPCFPTAQHLQVRMKANYVANLHNCAKAARLLKGNGPRECITAPFQAQKANNRAQKTSECSRAIQDLQGRAQAKHGRLLKENGPRACITALYQAQKANNYTQKTSLEPSEVQSCQMLTSRCQSHVHFYMIYSAWCTGIKRELGAHDLLCRCWSCVLPGD
jgi:hypothetical protein